MADLSGSNNTLETATDLGQINFSKDTFTGNVGVTDSGHPFDDPIDYFSLNTSSDVESITFSFIMQGLGNIYTSYWQTFSFTPVQGFKTNEVIIYYYDAGSFDGLFSDQGWVERFTNANPIVLEITPGSELVFAISVSGAENDTSGHNPGTRNLVPVTYEFGMGVWGEADEDDGTDTGIDTAQLTPLNEALFPSGLANLVDYDGNSLGSVYDWQEIGRTDVQDDGDVEIIMTNPALGRWATLGIIDNAFVDFSQHGSGGDTRVVGIYVDPFVESGSVEQGSAFDSQTRFENDVRSGNLSTVLGASDYDGDGFQEVYFGLSDGFAVLHAYMHSDGNIQYANYQSESDLAAYMTQNGISASVYEDWF